MNAPFYSFGLFGDQASLVVAFIIGIGFGFFLERAGFGVSPNLAAQFYLRDMRVLKVMFTAIITAMTGLYLLSRIGFVDLSQVYLVPTFLVPQIVGGLLLGIGFVIGGYCPGTSCVSAATGRVDGIVYVAGMFAGVMVYAEAYPHMLGFVHMTSMGQITLARLWDLPYGLLVFAVVLMALGAFVVAEWTEKKFGGMEPDPKGWLSVRPWRVTPVRVLVLGLLAAGFVALAAGSPYRGNHVTIDTKDLALRAGTGADTIQPTDIADWIVQDRNDYTLVDLRAAKDFDAYHIPGAQNLPMTSLSANSLARNQKIVLYSSDSTQAAKALFLLETQGFKSVYLLNDGIQGWHDTVLFPVKSPGMDAAAFEKLALVAKYFGGAPRETSASTSAVLAAPMAPTPAPTVAAPVMPAAPAGGIPAAQHKKKREGC